MAILKTASERMRSGLATKSADVMCAAAGGVSYSDSLVEPVGDGR